MARRVNNQCANIVLLNPNEPFPSRAIIRLCGCCHTTATAGGLKDIQNDPCCEAACCCTDHNVDLVDSNIAETQNSVHMVSLGIFVTVHSTKYSHCLLLLTLFFSKFEVDDLFSRFPLSGIADFSQFSV